MGVRSRSTTAFLILAVIGIGSAEAASRIRPPMPNAADHARSGSPSLGSGGGLRVNGPISGQYIPYGGGGGRKMHIPVSADYYYSIPRTFQNVKGMFRGGLPGFVMGAAIAGIGYGLDWIFDEAQQQWMKEGEDVPIEPDPSFYHWTMSGTSTPIFATPEEACVASVQRFSNANPSYKEVTLNSVQFTSASSASCIGDRIPHTGTTITNISNGGVIRSGINCPQGSSYNPDQRACVMPSAMEPITEADIAEIDQFQSSFDADWLQDILNNSCNGSTNPGGCIESLKDQAELTGPTTLNAPGTTTTSTTTNPDGTSSNTTTTTTTTISITYGGDYYDYSEKTTKTTTDPTGQTTTETTQDTGDEPTEEPPQEPEYTFADADFPEVEPFYEQQYPDGLEGVWATRSAEFQDSEFMEFLQSFVPSFSGSCPSWGLNVNVMKNANYGSFDFMNLCYVFDFIKAILTVTALFTARALIFGG